jgi:uncharacterized protein
MSGSPAMTTANTAPATPCGSNGTTLAELAAFGLVFGADRLHLIPFSETPFLFLLGWVALRLRRLRWRDVGFKRNRGWGSTLALGIGAGLLMEAFELFVSQPLLIRITGKQPDLSDFKSLEGNLKLSLLGLALIWTMAALGEEMVWRGYLMSRLADLGKRTRLAWIVSLVAANLLFGFGHSYQGVTGIIDEGLMGVLLGLMFLGTGGSLAVPIIAHGVQDTVDLLLIFLGKYPGL